MTASAHRSSTPRSSWVWRSSFAAMRRKLALATLQCKLDRVARLRYQFVDCRWELGSPGRGRERYLAGHVPGASFLDVDVDLSSEPGIRGRHPLPDADSFARAAGRAGISSGVFVVAYGNMGGAERLWWLLRHFGHDDCAVMDFDAWHGPLTSGDEQIEAADLHARVRDDDTIEAEELAKRLDELVVVDARLP